MERMWYDIPSIDSATLEELNQFFLMDHFQMLSKHSPKTKLIF